MASIKGYLYLIVAIGILVVAGAIYGKGRLDSSHAAAIESLQQQVDASDAALAQTRKDLAAAEKAAALDQLQALQDAKDKDQRNAFTTSQVPLLADPNRVCFDGTDGDRVRNLFAPYSLTSPPPEGADTARH